MHVFWVAGLLLALIDIPDFGTPLRSIADSVEKIADATPSEAAGPGNAAQMESEAALPTAEKSGPAKGKEHSHV